MDKLQFKFNRELCSYESNDPRIYVETRGKHPPKHYFKLFWEDRGIVFMATRESKDADDQNIKEVYWTLQDIRFPEARIGAYDYEDKLEAKQGANIMLSFLWFCDGFSNVFLDKGEAKIVSVELSDYLKNILK